MYINGRPPCLSLFIVPSYIPWIFLYSTEWYHFLFRYDHNFFCYKFAKLLLLSWKIAWTIVTTHVTISQGCSSSIDCIRSEKVDYSALKPKNVHEDWSMIKILRDSGVYHIFISSPTCFCEFTCIVFPWGNPKNPK